jgi:uncharacterized membrane protein
VDKALHFLLLVPLVLGVGLLVLGWRDRLRVDLSDQLAATLALFVGVLLAMLVELAEFVSDWAFNTQLQASNTDTMTDMLASDLGAVLGAVLATTLYHDWLTTGQRARLGVLGQWLSDGPSRVLDRHGFAITFFVAGALAVAIGVLWFTNRPVPGFPIG